MSDIREHPLDGVVDELANWLDKESSWYAQALIGEYRAPFSAPLNESQKLGAYRRMFYQHDSQGVPQYDKPNTTGREALFNRVTPAQYVQIAKAVGPRGGIEHMNSLEEPNTGGSSDATAGGNDVPSNY